MVYFHNKLKKKVTMKMEKIEFKINPTMKLRNIDIQLIKYYLNEDELIFLK